MKIKYKNGGNVEEVNEARANYLIGAGLAVRLEEVTKPVIERAVQKPEETPETAKEPVIKQAPKKAQGTTAKPKSSRTTKKKGK